MPEFGAESSRQLSSCHPTHKVFWSLIVQEYDCSILCGYRDETAQHQAFLEGLSHTDWPNSRHNSMPSEAVDVAPYPIDWQDTERFYHFAGYVLGRAAGLGVHLRWGGDWDSDMKLRDQSFFDLVHFELK